MAELDYLEFGESGDFPARLYAELDKLISGKLKGVKIENIPSSKFCELVGCEANDTNGWQCDWWGEFQYKDTTLHVFGCAWYATIAIGVD